MNALLAQSALRVRDDWRPPLFAHDYRGQGEASFARMFGVSVLLRWV